MNFDSNTCPHIVSRSAELSQGVQCSCIFSTAPFPKSLKAGTLYQSHTLAGFEICDAATSLPFGKALLNT